MAAYNSVGCFLFVILQPMREGERDDPRNIRGRFSTCGQHGNVRGISREAYELGKQFMDRLEPADKDELSKILEAHMEVLVAGMEEGYIYGFSDGIKLIMEAIKGKK